MPQSKLQPTLQEAFNLAAQHHAAGQFAQATAIYRNLIMEHPANADVHYNFGVALTSQGHFDQAIAAYQQALALRPGFLSAGINLGNLLQQARQPDQAVNLFLQTLAATRNDHAMIYNSLATSLQEVGRLDESLACFNQSMAILPSKPTSLSNRLCSLHFHPAYDAPAIFREARQWNDRFARPLQSEILLHDNECSPDRQLRIGYVSPDFRRHCQSMFTPPLLAHHNRNDFEIFCYSAVTAPDAATTRLQRFGHVWRDISRLTDPQAAQLIRQDKIDILVDLTLHMAGNRLSIFARKPAPIQVAWLGYPGTTGLDAIDYRLTDPRLDPLDLEINSTQNDTASATGFGTRHPFYSERSVYLPDTFWCYDPAELNEIDGISKLQPGPLPTLAAGRITFGCLNNFAKVSDRSLSLWGRVMASIPNSRLLLRAAPGPHRDQVARKLNVLPERVSFVPFQSRKQYMETYLGIDLCMDTIPYNGHTTNLDSLWMGVPVVTRVGDTVVGRGGWSQLHNLGLNELVARSDEQFVNIVVELAGNLDRLQHLHNTLRERMQSSPLMDGPRFARNMEAAYRQMWRAWCRGRD